MSPETIQNVLEFVGGLTLIIVPVLVNLPQTTSAQLATIGIFMLGHVAGMVNKK